MHWSIDTVVPDSTPQKIHRDPQSPMNIQDALLGVINVSYPETARGLETSHDSREDAVEKQMH